MSFPNTLRKGDFDLSASVTDEKSVVGTFKNDEDAVLFCDLAKPVVLAFVTKQTFTVAANSTETKDLAPSAPRVPFMDDPANGEFTENACLVGYFDKSGDGSKDTVVTDGTAVKIDGFTSDGNFHRQVTLTETAGAETDVDLYTVIESGWAKIRRRHKGQGIVTDQLTKQDSMHWAFSDPHDADRKAEWGPSNSGLNGAIGPDQYVDLVYYDPNETVTVPGANGNDKASNLRIQLPFQKRELFDNETYAGVRERIKQNMATAE